MGKKGIIRHENINCRSCISYQKCKSLDQKYKNQLDELDGQWRQIFEGSNRIGAPTRRCSEAIIQKHIEAFRNKRVLEIGCGPLSAIDKKFCEQNNIQYLGLDRDRLPLFYFFSVFGRGKNLQHKLYLKCLKRLGIKKIWRNRYQSFMAEWFPTPILEGEKFDLIYGNSTIEHWHENTDPPYIDDIEKSIELYTSDINKCYDLLNPGGKLIQECPVFLHGSILWKFAKINDIKKLFDSKWEEVVFEHWRENTDDLMPYSPKEWKIGFKEDYDIVHKNIWDLNIVATK